MSAAKADEAVEGSPPSEWDDLRGQLQLIGCIAAVAVVSLAGVIAAVRFG